MINPIQRFFVWNPSDAYDANSRLLATTYPILDFDQRKWFSVTGSPNHFHDLDAATHNLDAATDMAERHIDNLDPEVVAFMVFDDGELMSTSRERELDVTYSVTYPHYPDHPAKRDTLTRLQLAEVGRLGPSVDLVRYESGGEMTLAVFKYGLMQPHLRAVWDELHITKALKGHPSAVPFDRIILDEVESRVVGFTTLFLPGGDLKHNVKIPFSFRWLQQLTAFVDDLNLRYGIMHRDIAPRNLLVDGAGNLKVFDFNLSRKINIELLEYGSKNTTNDINGVIFTIHELLTCDDQFVRNGWHEQDVSKVENMAEWRVKRPLEEGTDLAACKRFLAEWVADRRTERTIQDYSEAKEPLEWPAFPEAEPCEHLAGFDEDEQPIRALPLPFLPQSRYLALQDRKHVVFWERPSQRIIDLQRAQRVQDGVGKDSASS
jgi:Protein tyrosine and serine/threonine kinase